MGNLVYRLVALMLFVYMAIRNIGNPIAWILALASVAWAYDTYRRFTKRSP